MRRVDRFSLRSLAVVAVLAAALAVLATLQYQWTGRLSESERHRLRAELNHAGFRFCEDFDSEVTRAFTAFYPAALNPEPELGTRLLASLRRWRNEASSPELVAGVLVVRRTTSGLEVQRLDPDTGVLASAPWPPALDPLRGDMAAGRPVIPLAGRLPGLVLTGIPPAALRNWARGGPEYPVTAPLYVVVRFDSTYITGDLLPHLVSAFFSRPDGGSYSVQIVQRGDEHDVVFSSGPSAGEGRPEVARGLFSLRRFPEILTSLRDGERGSQPGPPPSGEPPPRGRRDDDAFPGGRSAAQWLLLVDDPGGSLEATVQGARVRNLAIGLSVLALLGVTMLLLLISSQRAQRLARQQMDFVAAVSHELRTPLTAIRSAGQNLADGVVREPQQVKRYGALIEGEGRRLSELVARVLAFSGIRSGQQTYHFGPVSVSDVVAQVLADSRWVLDEKGFTVEQDVPRDLPAVAADAVALRQVVQNLVDNAVKFGARARWLGVRVRLTEVVRGKEVEISVADRGPGIARADLSRIFEPFQRGSDPAAVAVPGSGLGLSVVKHVVEAHGGRVTVETSSGHGATFTVHLPVPAAAAGKREAGSGRTSQQG